MLSIKEKRFIRHWEDQRKGGRWSYYLLYIIIGTFIITIILSVLLLIFFQVVFGSVFFWIVTIGGFIFSTIITAASWYFNEKKFRIIIRREVNAGREMDG